MEIVVEFWVILVFLFMIVVIAVSILDKEISGEAIRDAFKVLTLALIALAIAYK